MKLGLDTIASLGAQGNSKSAVLHALFAITARNSVLGTYGFDKNGDTTLKAYGVYKVGSTGEPVFFETLKRGGGARRPLHVHYAASTLLPAHQREPVETTTISPSPPPALAARPLAAVRRFFGRWGLIAALAALPLYYGITDLTNGYQAGFVAGHVVIHHDLSKLGFNFAEGLSNGAIWALIAIGYTLVYGIIELINFAHGDVFMIGSFTAVGLWATLGLGLTTGALGLIGGLLVTLIIAMLVTGSLNVLIERVAYRPLRSAPKLASLITAVGFSFILQNVGLLWRGGSPQSVNDLIRSQQPVFTIGGVHILRGYILAFAVMIPLVFALTWFINTTRAGRAMRATAQDPEAARLMGINVNATISLTFLLRARVRALRDQHLVLPGLQGRTDRVHRGGRGRHR